MTTIRRVLSLIAVLIVSVTIGFAQDAKSTWQVGEQFVFRPFWGPPDAGSEHLTIDLLHDRYKGTTATIISIEKRDCDRYDTPPPCLIVEMRADRDGKVFKLRWTPLAERGLTRLSDIKAKAEAEARRVKMLAETEARDADAHSREIERLRVAYQGKTFWLRSERYRPLKCIDVLPNEIQIRMPGPEPLRLYGLNFVLETASGERVTRTIYDENQPFGSQVFFTRDPRQIFPPRVWAFIERSRVFVGMTKDQALASWGRPEHVNRTTTRLAVSEQWVYGDGTYVYFTNGRLTVIQD
jgi:hypothetical protein